MAFFNFHNIHLEELARINQRRILSSTNGKIFSSNDYLALANSDALKNAAIKSIEGGISIGSGGSRLLSGNHSEHIKLEQEACAYFNSQSCLYFSTGYSANIAVLSTLPQKGDLILYDEYIHASSHEGMRLSLIHI